MVDFIIGVGIGIWLLLAVFLAATIGIGASKAFNKGWRAGVKAFRKANGI